MKRPASARVRPSVALPSKEILSEQTSRVKKWASFYLKGCAFVGNALGEKVYILLERTDSEDK